MLKYEDFYSRGREVFSSRWKKNLEDQIFSSNKSEENDISRINFLEISFSKINFQKRTRGLKSRDEKPNLEILIPRVCFAEAEESSRFHFHPR